MKKYKQLTSGSKNVRANTISPISLLRKKRGRTSTGSTTTFHHCIFYEKIQRYEKILRYEEETRSHNEKIQCHEIET